VGFHRLRLISCLLVLAGAPVALPAAELTGIRLASGPTATRVVLDVDGPTAHRLLELENPSRLVIDLPNARAGSSIRLPQARGRVRAVRTGRQSGGTLRVVLDLTAKSDSKSFVLAPDGEFGHRVVIDLTEAGRSAPVKRMAETKRDLVIVIDAGHGGHDPGAIGPTGIREKDVALQIAKRVADYMRQEPGITPVLVRDRDVFVTLPDRVRIARDANADLFLSIHADAVERGSAEGATIYVLDTTRAADETTKRLANRENGVDLGRNINLSDVDDDMVARFVLDLSQGAVIGESRVAGQRVINQLSRVATMRKTKVEEGNFFVLTSPDIPSVFVESAYISNPREEKNLADPAFQNQFAYAIYAGILDYFRTNAPGDSYLAHNPPPERRGPIRHVIARGETLSEIAERYRISLRELRQSNRLRGDVIRIGQVLTIPIG
jgi:N-acetylmuramoyl-L-alanine amidase